MSTSTRSATAVVGVLLSGEMNKTKNRFLTHNVENRSGSEVSVIEYASALCASSRVT